MKHWQVAIVCVGLAILLTGALIVIPRPSAETKFGKQVYVNLLTRLRSEGYTFALPTSNITGKTAILIHDVDFSYEGAETLASVEREFGVKSCFYLRPDAEYWTFPKSIQYFRGLECGGWQIGLHYDCLSRADGNMTFALELFKAQVEYTRKFFNIQSTSYHGDNYNLSINNYDLYEKNKLVWQTLNLTEIYSLENYSYIRDTNFNLVIPESLGDLVLVQFHADYW